MFPVIIFILIFYFNISQFMEDAQGGGVGCGVGSSLKLNLHFPDG